MHRIAQTLYSQKTLHTSPLRASYGVSFVSILAKNNRVIKGFYCIHIYYPSVNYLIIGPDITGDRPLSEPRLAYFLLTIETKLNKKINENKTMLIQETEFEIDVCKMEAILSRPQCVKWEVKCTDWIYQLLPLDLCTRTGSKIKGWCAGVIDM